MPREGGKSVADDLRKRFPDMHWLQGHELHFSKAGVSHTWLPLKEAANAAPAVIAAIRDAGEESQGLGQTMVFCQSVQSAKAMHAELLLVCFAAYMAPSHQHHRANASIVNDNIVNAAASGGVPPAPGCRPLSSQRTQQTIERLHGLHWE